MNRYFTILNLIFAILFFMMLLSCHSRSDEESTVYGNEGSLKTELTEAEPEPVLDLFGVDESLKVTTHIIRRNESLSAILRNHGLSPIDIHQLAKASSGVFDLRRMRAGRPLHIYFESDSIRSTQQVAYAVYEDTPFEFVRFHLADSIFVERDSKPTEIRTRLVSGTISQSLYQTLRQLDANPYLTHRLADVFAWQVDFYRIQPGDHFSVLFEERRIEGEVTEITRIKAAVFSHQGTDFYAFLFNQNGSDEYFDEEGNSLRRQFLAAPLDYTRISSRFTNRRFHPVLRRNMPHHGTDYAAPTGTPVRAVGDGTITAAQYGRNNGNYIRIRHNSVYETGYLHLSRFADGMRPGTQVKQGQIIGYVGATGLATGPHLCFRFWQHGQPADPRRIDLPPAEPIQNEYRASFTLEKERLLKQLGIDPDSVLDRPVIFAIQTGYNGVLSNHSR